MASIVIFQISNLLNFLELPYLVLGYVLLLLLGYLLKIIRLLLLLAIRYDINGTLTHILLYLYLLRIMTGSQLDYVIYKTIEIMIGHI